MTQLSLDAPGPHLYIRSVDESGIVVGEQRYAQSLIVTPRELLEGWPPQRVDEITPAHLDRLLESDPELVLLGTGARQHFLPPERLAAFYRRQVGIEMMTTEAACRTFNVLASEGRRAVAALLPLLG